MLNTISITSASGKLATKRAASTLLLEQGSMVDGGTVLLDSSVRLSA